MLRKGVLTIGAAVAAALGVVGVAHAQQEARPGADPRSEFVIAAVGDGYASGEGNPIIPGDHDTRGRLTGSPEEWGPDDDPDARRCHRSPLAHASRAARILRERHPDLRIRLIHVACSGAGIVTGLLEGHQGVEPGTNPDNKTALPPQIEQINRALGDTRADALIINIGASDIGLAEILAWCAALPAPDCTNLGGLVEGARERLARLPTLYDRLQASVRGAHTGTPYRPLTILNKLPGRIYLVAYPDPTGDAEGRTCHRTGVDAPFRNLARRELRWLQNDILRRLNGALAEAAANGAALGEPYTLVDSHLADFQRHGICAPDPFFLSNRGALLAQGADAFNLLGTPFSKGFAHPNDAGHANLARHIADAVSRQIQDDHDTGAPTLSAGAVNRTSIELAWTVPAARAIDRFELEIRRAGTTPDQAQTVTLPGSFRSFTHRATGTYIYRLRACGPAGCSPRSLTRRLSNLGAEALSAPVNLRQAEPAPAQPGGQPAPDRSIALAWDVRGDDYAFFEVAYRPLRIAADTPTAKLSAADAQRIRGAERTLQRALGTLTLRNLTTPNISVPRFAVVRTTDANATLGNLHDPLDPDRPYEVKVRACSTIACTRYTDSVVMQPGRPAATETVALDRRQRTARTGRQLGLGVAVKPGADSTARGFELRLLGRHGEVGRVRVDGRTGRIGLTGREQVAGPARKRARALPTATGRAGAAGAPLRSGPLTISLRASRARAAAGTLKANLALILRRELAGQVLTIEAASVDARGRRQPFATAGSVIVRP